MKDYLLVYRTDYSFLPNRTPEEMQAMSKRWMDWFGSIAAQNKLTDRGNRLDFSGKVVRNDNTVTNGPYAEIKESIGGYSVIKAESYEAAVEIAKGCPVFKVGGNVEVREIAAM
ncbi:transcription initiation protein [Niastella caeni]|uniref:Transcription initiation protein n=1 Tax=Niastella caeni TaxID=2569763 RepID=A0A4S8HRM3_9BACT|nr:YciI family protein [Niastella caeni]THU38093.1 transcription initiation protein [Niastella caeni]